MKMPNSLELMGLSHPFRFLLMEGEARETDQKASDWREAGLVVRRVRGRKMRSLRPLFDEFAAALQFPWYFGENREAFVECIADLGWLPPQSGYVIVVLQPGEVLADEPAAELKWLIEAFVDAAEVWTTPIENDEWWDRPAIPFHVVLCDAPTELTRAMERWAGAGALVGREV